MKKYNTVYINVVFCLGKDIVCGSVEVTEPTYGTDGTEDYGYDFWN